ncbi:hypothetical protein P775_26735 [Puniceibacterium antarcticum]|uniref:Uncharacterized protein n=1 Tax=Puniceibacterium antarcticum TaxID=1206336 RepID=A0A2G8QYD4_9RHOB|nr:hypothetical protein [Puniceibacterium antarcticum]PIL14304.1 hypothetical protein P775_26735 [Puniceibacterium antarcticum]
MSISRWIIAIAFGLIACLGAAQEQPTPKDQPGQSESATNAGDGGQENQYKTIELTSALDRIEAAIRDLIAEEDKIEQERAREQASRDLNAQEGMAWWAELMFYATAATVALTFVALFAIIRTLFHTKRAADAAHDMVDEARATTTAAERGALVAREIGEAQVRAYVSVDEISISESPDAQGRYEARVTLKNTGQSPAWEVHNELQVAFAATFPPTIIRANSIPLPPVKAQAGSAKNDIPAGNFLHAKSHTPVGMCNQNSKDLIAKGYAVLFARGWVEYKDVFGGLHRTEYTWHRDRETIDAGFSIAASENGNKST